MKMSCWNSSKIRLQLKLMKSRINS